MNRIAHLCAVLALVGCAATHSPPAEAGTSTISWVNPVQNTDNSAIVDTAGDESRLESWRIEFGTCTAPGVFGAKAGEVVRPRAAGPLLTSAVLNTASGLKCFRVYVTNLSATESDVSNATSRTVDAPKPKAPTNVTAAP